VSEKRTNRVVLDSYAVLAYLEAEPEADMVTVALDQGDAWMTLVNLGEVLYIIERKRGKASADTIFLPISWRMTTRIVENAFTGFP